MRAGGPFGNPYSLSYQDDFYIRFFFYDWFFFFLINLIMLNIINAIIVDSFQNFREEKTKADNKLNNFCYICNLPKIMFEMYGVDFEKHIQNEHNIKHYMNLLIKIFEQNRFNLNSIQTRVKYLMGVKQVDFFPDKMALSLKRNKK